VFYLIIGENDFISLRHCQDLKTAEAAAKDDLRSYFKNYQREPDIHFYSDDEFRARYGTLKSYRTACWVKRSDILL
jgi:hypothetical protein